MELGGEPWLGLVSDSFVGAVVHIDEKRLPVVGQGVLIDSETVNARCLSYQSAVDYFRLGYGS